MIGTLLAPRQSWGIFFFCYATRIQPYNWNGVLFSSRNFFSTSKKSHCVVTGGGNTRRGKHFLPKSDHTRLPGSKQLMLSQIHQLSRQNIWQEAFHLFSCNSMNQHTMEMETVFIEALIAALLFYGFDQSALSVWRAASKSFHFFPSSMLLLKLAVYNLLVNDKGQESMDLAKRMNEENGEVLYELKKCRGEETALVECIECWIGFYGSLLYSRGLEQVEDSQFIQANLGSIWRLAHLSQADGVNRLGQMQYFFHGVSVMSLTNLRLREMLSFGDLKYEYLCLFYAVDLITGRLAATSPVATAQMNDNLIPPANTFPFLLCILFPLLVGYTSENTHKFVATGLTQYQIFFNSDGEWMSRTTVATVGAVWMNELWKRGLDEKFIHSVVTHDINASDKTPLMVQLLLVPSKMMSPTLCGILGKKIFFIVERAFKHAKKIGDKEKRDASTALLAVEYVSRVLEPFRSTMSIQERRLSTGIQKQFYFDSIAASSSFYLELLGSLLAKTSQSGVLWERLIVRVIDQLRIYSASDGSLIPFQWRCRMHREWWFPALLDFSDPERERKLSIALQQDPISVLKGREQHLSWNRVVGDVLHVFHEQWYNDDILHWTHSVDEISQRRVHGCCSKKLHIQRALVQRFVRWEWLLEGVWELMRANVSNTRENLLHDLLYACINTLDRCRTFHRSDIAGDLLQILFLPATPFIDSFSAKSAPYNLFSCLMGELTSEKKKESDPYCKQMPEWKLLNEVFRWLPSLQAWKIMDDLQEQFFFDVRVFSQRFLTLRYLIDDLSIGWRGRQQHGDSCGASECERMRCVAAHYEKACRVDLSLRTPHLLVPLFQSLRRAGLVEEMTGILRRTFVDIQNDFYAPHHASASRRVEDALLFFHSCYEEAESLCISSHATAKGMVGAVAETYLFSRWEREDCTAVERVLLKPSNQDYATTSASFASEAVFSTSFEKTCFEERAVAFFLPVAEREALRTLFVLFIAHYKSASAAIALIRRLPVRRADAFRTAAYVQRLIKQETKLFASCATMAVLVVSGEKRLRDACVALSENNTALCRTHSNYDRESLKGKERFSDAHASPRRIRTLRDLNRCIDRHDWALALEAIPHVLTEPLHMTRKALLACEKASVKGAAWEGAMTVFAKAVPVWKQHNSRGQLSFGSTHSEEITPCTKTSRCYAVGLQECGRIMTILADGKRWREALQVFESLGSSGVDGYIFTQACFALRAGGRPDLALDLWAMWRAAVGDAVTPTPSMCGQLVRCGVVGNETTATAACTLIQKASEGVAQTPGAELPLSFEKEENAIVALLRDRWHESWQEALRVALASRRPRIVESVAWRSPRNHSLYEAVVSQAKQEQRVLSVKERSAIASHLNLVGVLDAKASDPEVDIQEHEQLASGVTEENAARVLRELLGDDES